MKPGTYNIAARNNADLVESFDVLDDDGTPVNMTAVGWSAKLVARTAVGGTVILEASTANTRITLGNGTVQVRVPEAVMRLLAGPFPVSGVYDLIVQDPTGKIEAELEGVIEIVRGVGAFSGNP